MCGTVATGGDLVPGIGSAKPKSRSEMPRQAARWHGAC
jgi:hypothetical protein